MSFQTCMSFFLMLNIKEDSLKNAGYQTVDSSIDIVFISLLWTSVGINNCLVLQNSSNYLLLCSTQEINLNRFVTITIPLKLITYFWTSLRKHVFKLLKAKYHK